MEQHPTIAEIIKKRRTVRLFKTDPVSTELIVELLDVAIWAPTHGVRQPWRFILYRDEARTSFAQAVIRTYNTEEQKKYARHKMEYYTTVPAHLIVVFQEDARQKQRDEDYAAVCAMIQNFQLAAWERGLGVVWKTNSYIYDPKFRETAGVRPGEKIVGVLHIGYPDVVPSAGNRTPAERLLTVVERGERVVEG